MDEVAVPRYVLESLQNVLHIWANLHNSYDRETCLDRNTMEGLICLEKLLAGKPLTGMERLERSCLEAK